MQIHLSELLSGSSMQIMPSSVLSNDEGPQNPTAVFSSVAAMHMISALSRASSDQHYHVVHRVEPLHVEGLPFDELGPNSAPPDGARQRHGPAPTDGLGQSPRSRPAPTSQSPTH